MGIVKKGPARGWSGKVGGVVYSQHADRETTVSEVPDFSKVQATEAQLMKQEVMKILGPALRPLKYFVRAGVRAKGMPKGQTPYNVMVKQARRNAVQGVYPHQYVDYSKLLITQGTMAPPREASVKLTEKGFDFSWSPDDFSTEDHYTDQIMVMAYFPELGATRYKTSCAERHVGRYLLELDGIKKGYRAVIYISMITDERDRISDSVYLGELIW